MATVSRANIVSGPAKIEINNPSAATLYTQSDVSVSVINETFDINTSAHGKADTRFDDARVEVGFTPDGSGSDALAAVLWPYANTAMGASIFSSTDKTLIIHGNDGAKHTVIAAALTQMPDIILSANKTMIGQATYTGIRGAGLDWATASSLYTIGTGATFVDTGWTIASVLTQRYTGVWGAITGFTDIHTEDGWVINFDLQTAPIVVDDIGTVDMRVQSVGVMARCVPVGGAPTSAQILSNLNNQATGKARGRSLGTSGADLTITGENTTTSIVLNGCGLVSAGYRFGSAVVREGELAFVATRDFTSGAQNALWTIDFTTGA